MASTVSPDPYNSIRHLQSPPFISDKEPENSHINLYDEVPQLAARLFTNSNDFEDHLSSTPQPPHRIVSISCQYSLEPLGITQTAMRKLMDTYDIDASFLDHVVSFGDKPRRSDAGQGAMTVWQRHDGCFDMHYRFSYWESSDNSPMPTSFTCRQVCVFHRYSPSGAGNLWIFLHAGRNSRLEQKLKEVLSVSTADVLQDWFSLHLLVFATYHGNWRWHLRSLGDKIEKTVDIAFTMHLSNGRGTDNLDRLLEPHYLGDNLVPLSSQLGVVRATICKMAKINRLFLSKGLSTETQFQRLADATDYYTSSLEGYLRSVQVLERKIQGISNSLAAVLTLNNQYMANGLSNQMLSINDQMLQLTNASLKDGANMLSINNQMLQLTNAAFKDSANVLVITLLTLFYLPSSFVSTLFGMNLFDFEGPDHDGFAISKKFWIFVICAAPLTIFTLGFWYYFTRRRLRARLLSQQAPCS